MTSFLELPRIGLRGIDLQSTYVNVDDIVAFQDEYDGQVVVELRGYGDEGGTGRVRTYAPIAAIIRALELLTENPTVYSWPTDTKTAWSAPLKAKLEEAYAAERAAR